MSCGNYEVLYTTLKGRGDRDESALSFFFFFPTRRERAVYKLEGCTIHT